MENSKYNFEILLENVIGQLKPYLVYKQWDVQLLQFAVNKKRFSKPSN